MVPNAINVDRPARGRTVANIVSEPWMGSQISGDQTRPADALNGRMIDRRKAHHIFFHGDRADRYFELVVGAVSAYVQLLDGRRQIFDFFFPGDIFGVAPAGEYSYSAEALSKLTLRSYPATPEAFAPNANGAELRALLKWTLSSLHRAHNRMLSLGRKRAEERLASFLLQMADRIGTGLDDTVELPMTRLDIADYLGLTIETISRTFSELKRDGLIALPTSRHVVLLQFDALHDLAGEEDSL
jgi:CRP/FNR family nitrogen fixation transcriptional regulator